MRTKWFATAAVVFALAFAATIALESTASARAGSGGSSGSRGSRSFSSPSRPSPQPSSPSSGAMSRQQTPTQSPSATPGAAMTGNPFWRGLAGGFAGGMIGSLLFGGMGHAANGSMGGGGIGLFDLILLGAGGWFLFRWFKRRRQQEDEGRRQPYGFRDVQAGPDPQPSAGAPADAAAQDLERGLANIRQFDTSFDEARFREAASDNFFRIQAAWMNRTLEGAGNLFTDEMAKIFEEEFAEKRRKGTINRIENIAVRRVELAEAWQEQGQDYITVLFTANLLDYTVDEKSGEVVAGDRMNPVKFEEFWTFRREVGAKDWKLSAIQQAE